MRSLLPIALFIVTSLAAQSPTAPAPAAPAPPTLRTQARLVVVDVVVTDRDHHPIHGLTRADFTVAEDKSPQTLKSFDEHHALTPGEAAKLQPMPPMPPGVFTNYTAAPSNSAVNVLLLDALNTPLQDQAYVRNQLLQYLKNSAPGANVAIFGLSTQLVMLQGFTSNPEILKSVVNKGTGKASPLLDDQVGGGGMPDTVADTNALNGNLLPADVAANLQTFENITQSFQLQLRAKYTLDAMSALAHYLASVPGRKNLIWFSGSFPINILPDSTGESGDPFAGVADSEKEYRDTTNLLAFSQVSVYPIDARGLQTLPMFSAASSGAKYAANPRAMNRDLSTFTQSQFDEHSTMFRMAEDTGGRAFVNTNGLAGAVASAIDEGSNYYALAYTPNNSKWRGDYRKINVALTPAAVKSGYQLAYRRGYYAEDPNSPTSALALAAPKPEPATGNAPTPTDPTLMQKAMAHGVPGATQILYKVLLRPIPGAPEDAPAPGNRLATPPIAKPPYRRFAIDFAAVVRGFSWTETPDGVHHATAQFVSLVYQPDGRLVNTMTRTVTATLSADRYTALLQGGFPMHLELSVPVKGDFSIRTGIFDLNSNHIGAVEVPVGAIPTPKPAPPASPTPPTRKQVPAVARSPPPHGAPTPAHATP